MNIYQRARHGKAQFAGRCCDISLDQWNEYMKGARKANYRKVLNLFVNMGIIERDWRKWYNPYDALISRDFIIFVHSGIEHFLKVDRS